MEPGLSYTEISLNPEVYVLKDFGCKTLDVNRAEYTISVKIILVQIIFAIYFLLLGYGYLTINYQLLGYSHTVTGIIIFIMAVANANIPQFIINDTNVGIKKDLLWPRRTINIDKIISIEKPTLTERLILYTDNNGQTEEYKFTMKRIGDEDQLRFSDDLDKVMKNIYETHTKRLSSMLDGKPGN